MQLHHNTYYVDNFFPYILLGIRRNSQQQGLYIFRHFCKARLHIHLYLRQKEQKERGIDTNEWTSENVNILIQCLSNSTLLSLCAQHSVTQMQLKSVFIFKKLDQFQITLRIFERPTDLNHSTVLKINIISLGKYLVHPQY